jgi:hypothetical protein
MKLTDKELQEVCDEYERLIHENNIKWIQVDKSTLPKSVCTYIEHWLDYFNIKYQIAELRLKGTILFKVDDPVVKYLHHHPTAETHMWVGEGFHNAIGNNKALAQLASRTGMPKEALEKLFGCMDTEITHNFENN